MISNSTDVISALQEKFNLINISLREVSAEINLLASKIEVSNPPLFRMLTENGTYYIDQAHKNLFKSGQIDILMIQINRAVENIIQLKIDQQNIDSYMSLPAVTRGDLIVGRLYSDIPVLNKQAAVMRFVGSTDDNIKFAFVLGQNSYAREKDELISFSLTGDDFFEINVN